LKFLKAVVDGRFHHAWKKSPRIKRIAEAYKSNMRRVEGLVDLPMDTAESMLMNERASRPGSSIERTAAGFRLTDDARRAVAASAAKLIRAMESRESSRSRHGLLMVLSSALIGTWTAFESIATDLWIEAVNRRPTTLGVNALLAPREGESEKQEGKSEKKPDGFSLETLERYKFNLKHRIGTVVHNEKRKFDFTSTGGIRNAYLRTFAHRRKDGGIVTRPEVKGWFPEHWYQELSMLEAIRHVLVHRGGSIDDAFRYRAKEHPEFSKLNLGDTFPVTGPMIRQYSTASFLCASKLLDGVDDWLSRNPS